MKELKIEITEPLESCHRAGELNINDKIEYFAELNSHMGLDEDIVSKLFYEFDC